MNSSYKATDARKTQENHWFHASSLITVPEIIEIWVQSEKCVIHLSISLPLNAFIVKIYYQFIWRIYTTYLSWLKNHNDKFIYEMFLQILTDQKALMSQLNESKILRMHSICIANGFKFNSKIVQSHCWINKLECKCRTFQWFYFIRLIYKNADSNGNWIFSWKIGVTQQCFYSRCTIEWKWVIVYISSGLHAAAEKKEKTFGTNPGLKYGKKSSIKFYKANAKHIDECVFNANFQWWRCEFKPIKC